MKSWLMLLLWEEITYSASDGKKVPVSSVDAGAVVLPTAPITVFISNTPLPFTEMPSTSKKVT